MCAINKQDPNTRLTGQNNSEIGVGNYTRERLSMAWRKIVRFGFRLLYNELSFTYDSISWLVSLGQWREWQRAAIPFIKGPKVLEIAPGTGHMMLDIDQDRHQVYGLELSPYMVKIISRRMSRNHSKALLIQGQAQHLPFADCMFTSVLATFPSEFIFAPETLSGVWRTLVDRGLFVIVLGAQLGGSGVTERLIRSLYKITGQDISPNGLDIQALLTDRLAEQPAGKRFRHYVKQMEVRGSLVTLVILEKLKVEPD